jgi:uridylate kinase
VESEEELEVINQIAVKTSARANIGIRVNPDVDAKTHKKITTGKAENKFGIAWPQALELYKKASKMKGIAVKGISVHIGSQIMSLKPFGQAFERLAGYVERLEKENIPVQNIDLGGGLGIAYNYAKDKAIAAEDYGRLVNKYFKRFGKKIIIEPGRRIVADCGILVSKVLYNKKGTDKNFLIIDAAMNDLARPALYDAWHEIVPCAKRSRPSKKVDIVGGVCESSDVFAKARLLPALKRGELVAIMDAGAYGSSMSSTYNSRPLAPEILVDGSNFSVIRKRKTYREILGEQTENLRNNNIGDAYSSLGQNRNYIKNNISVLKFGGNTLANKEKILLAVNLIKQRYQAGVIPVIVASANGNMTDILLDNAYSFCSNPNKRELDMLITTGERISVALLAIALNNAGLPAVSLTGSQIGLTTTAQHAGADIKDLSNDRLQKELEQKHIPIIAGFQGIGEHREITTLKRGGSDVSAVFIASELGAPYVEMIKDVDGVYSKDPNKNADAQKLNLVDFDVMYKMALEGANVLHPDAIKLAKQKNIKIKIVYYKTGETGTVIS